MSVPPENPDEEIVEGWATAPVSGDRVDVHQGPIIAGTPGGARVEVTGDGLHAYDSDGVETAHIRGEGGEFVGGSFRTSDHLPGQVTLSNTAYLPSWGAPGRSGIRVTPEDASSTDIPPGIGPSLEGLVLDGGRSTTGRSSFFRAAPEGAMMRTVREDGSSAAETLTSHLASLMRTYNPDGGYGVAQTTPQESQMRTYNPSGESGYMFVTPNQCNMRVVNTDGTSRSRITATRTAVTLFTFAGGAQRYLEIDADGIWVRTERNGTLRSYNLEETAQDSGWQAIPLASGVTGAGSPAWRNKGGVIYFRGTINATWTDGWNTVATGLPTEMRPNVRVVRTSPSTGGANLLFRMDSDGLLQFYRPGNGAVQGDLSGLFYPLG